MQVRRGDAAIPGTDAVGGAIHPVEVLDEGEEPEEL